MKWSLAESIHTKEEIKKFLIIYHHLTDAYSMEEKDIVPYVQKIGCIQFDPLDVVGRNPDLVLQARVVDYRKAYLEKLLYEDRLLFDAWDKNMYICVVEDWPHFAYFRQTFGDWCEKYREAIREISAYLKEVDCACSSDFDMEERVRWHYGPQRLAKAALECMCYAGLAVVHHKVGTRRYYGLAEKYLPEHLIGQPNPYQNRAEYEKACVLRRIKGIGVLWNKAGDAWLGLSGLKQENRNRALKLCWRRGKSRDLGYRE